MLKFSEIFELSKEKFRKIPILKEFEWFEWFEWFGPSPIEPFNPARNARKPRGHAESRTCAGRARLREAKARAHRRNKHCSVEPIWLRRVITYT